MDQKKPDNYFTLLNGINVNDKVEKKNNLSYLSWSFAWGEVKKLFPDATYTIYERDTEFGPVNYFTDGRTGWVKTGVTINGIEHIEELPIMDNRNNAIIYDAIMSTDVNKAIQRSLTKAIARHGLGLYIYAGEDLPEAEKNATQAEAEAAAEATKARARAASAAAPVAKPAATAGADATTPAAKPASADLQDTIKAIGGYAKKIRLHYGSLKPYQEVVTSVTGDPTFKCNVADESALPLLKKILETLKQDPAIQ